MPDEIARMTQKDRDEYNRNKKATDLMNNLINQLK